MAFIGIVGARKYKDKQAVIELVECLPLDSVIVTSGCRGVCAWAKTAAERRGMKVEIFSPDLNKVRSNFEVAKRYYQRNRELIQRCQLVHAFLSEEDGCTGGTGFEVEYASKIGRPVQIHWENGGSNRLNQYAPSEASNPMFEGAWQTFFVDTFA